MAFDLNTSESASQNTQPHIQPVSLYNVFNYTPIGFFLSLLPVLYMSWENARRYPEDLKVRLQKRVKVVSALFAILLISFTALFIGVLSTTAEQYAEWASKLTSTQMYSLQKCVNAYDSNKCIDAIIPPGIVFGAPIVRWITYILFGANLILLIGYIRFVNKTETPYFRELKKNNAVSLRSPILPILGGVIFMTIINVGFSYLGTVVIGKSFDVNFEKSFSPTAAVNYIDTSKEQKAQPTEVVPMAETGVTESASSTSQSKIDTAGWTRDTLGANVVIMLPPDYSVENMQNGSIIYTLKINGNTYKINYQKTTEAELIQSDGVIQANKYFNGQGLQVEKDRLSFSCHEREACGRVITESILKDKDPFIGEYVVQYDGISMYEPQGNFEELYELFVSNRTLYRFRISHIVAPPELLSQYPVKNPDEFDVLRAVVKNTQDLWQ